MQLYLGKLIGLFMIFKVEMAIKQYIELGTVDGSSSLVRHALQAL